MYLLHELRDLSLKLGDGAGVGDDLVGVGELLRDGELRAEARESGVVGRRVPGDEPGQLCFFGAGKPSKYYLVN